MVELKLYNKDGKENGIVKAEDKLFAAKHKDAVVHQVLTWYLASKRSGTHSSKGRSEVRGGGRKPWKQKGTGRARAGTIRSPLWNGGGVIFGPKPRSYAYNLPKKIQKAGLKAVLTDRTKAEKVKIVEEFSVSEPKTKLMLKALNKLKLVNQKTLIIKAKEDKNVVLSARNIERLKVAVPADINIADLLNSDWVIVEQGALPVLAEVLL